VVHPRLDPPRQKGPLPRLQGEGIEQALPFFNSFDV